MESPWPTTKPRPTVNCLLSVSLVVHQHPLAFQFHDCFRNTAIHRTLGFSHFVSAVVPLICSPRPNSLDTFSLLQNPSRRNQPLLHQLQPWAHPSPGTPLAHCPSRVSLFTRSDATNVQHCQPWYILRDRVLSWELGPSCRSNYSLGG
jgi:hypothetical protein